MFERQSPSHGNEAAGLDGAGELRLLTIRTLNDLLRQGFPVGRVNITRGVYTLPLAEQLRVMLAVQNFNSFDDTNDPWGEHDFGSVEHDGVSYLFKVDYYDRRGVNGSPDPADPEVTLRTLTIMRADEY